VNPPEADKNRGPDIMQWLKNLDSGLRRKDEKRLYLASCKGALLRGSFLFQRVLEFLASPAVEKAVVNVKHVKGSSNRVIDDIIQGLWRK